MAQLYRHKWRSSEGDIYDADRFTDGFLLWCRKTEGLTDKQWRMGFEQVEEDLRIAARKGNPEPWPPSYAVFVEKCQVGVNRQLYKSFASPLLIEDEAARDRRMAVGAAHCENLLKMFD